MSGVPEKGDRGHVSAQLRDGQFDLLGGDYITWLRMNRLQFGVLRETCGNCADGKGKSHEDGSEVVHDVWFYSPVKDSSNIMEAGKQVLAAGVGFYSNFRLGEDFLHKAGMFHPRELVIESLIFDGEAFVVDAEQVQHGRVEVADMDDVVGNVVSEIVGGSNADATANSATGHPDGITSGMVIPAVEVVAL